MGILDEDVARVRDATDLVALASEHIALKRVGRASRACARSTPEKSPSFSVNPEMGVFYCFGCQESGDAITFIRELEHLDFVEAVERLAARAGITLRYDDDARLARTASASSACTRRSAAAIDFYHELLLERPDARHCAPLPAQPRLRR